MKLIIKTPKQSLNKAFLKIRPLRSDIDHFKENLIKLLGKIDEIEREENQKTHVRDFLRDTYYKETNEINTKDTKDLVIHIGKTNKDKVGIILEAKRPSNRSEMITAGKPNAKAFQELVLYYLRERVEEKNNDIKFLVATNINEWFIFEASYFEKAFFKNKTFVKQYEDWRDGKKVTKDTTLFYNEIAKPFINDLEDEIPCTYFDIRTYQDALRNTDKQDDKKLIQLFKILSPNHLLKVSFADDSNTLDDKFYKELLHIIGLEEYKDGSKLIIRRKLEDKRNVGSLLEMAISILETEDPLHKVTAIQNYGENKEKKTYNVALELCITWINRILFLKLLEGQLVNYHKGDRAYRFLNSDMIRDFDELYKLFHQVLAKTTDERSKAIKEKYSRVPYLNSSLFEISELEDQTLKINQLDNSALLELIGSSILKEDKKKNESLPSLEYIFRFLDAYDFASEGTEDIQEDSKKLINASVLGKVFEKINGYKDGSIFTPGFITMYMCRQSIRLAVLQKFTDKYGWKADTFDDLKNYLADKKSSKDTLLYNKLINSLHICDPAVGSGHFLVSSLNEIIAIKSELGLLADAKGVRIADYEVTIENDELIVSDFEGEIFEYQSPLLKKGKSGEAMQRLQSTLFHEKQTIIENSLFGVDINPNSVKICRLRLWIELLKNAYYKDSDYTELETLPNIDINIKCGNSLLSRFPLDIDLSDAFKKQQFNLETYKSAVEAYRKTSDKKAKGELTVLIKKIKEEYTTTIYKRDPRRKKLAEIRGQIALVQNNVDLFGTKKLSDKDKTVEERRLTLLLEKREKELEEAEQGVMYRNAFEWRFEFPEVLDSNGKYEGFDLVIGNPPYISAIDLKKSVAEGTYKILKNNYSTAKGTVDLFIYFFEHGLKILKSGSYLSYITPNRYLSASYGEAVREFLFKETTINEIIDYSHVKVFKEASTYPIVSTLRKNTAKPNVKKYDFQVGKYNVGSETIDFKIVNSDKLNFLEGFIWGYLLNEKIHITEKIINSSVPITKCANINATSTAGEADEYHSLINEKTGFKLINTGTIDRYTTTWGKEKLTDKGVQYLNPYLPTDSNLISANRKKLYESPKIILAKIAIRTEAFLDEQGDFASINTNCFHSFSDHFNSKYILAWLNSKLFQYTFECFFEGLKMQGGYLLYSSPNVSKMFIKEIDLKDQKPFISLVDKIILAKQKERNTEALENEIDDLFFKLYSLSKNEVAIINGKQH
jgi:adenine-specific DNA-methyltransferase